MEQREYIPARSLIPHRRRMQLLEWVKSPNQNGLQAETTVHESWPLKRDGTVDCIVCLELVAQAVSALSTWRHGKGAKPRMGLLVGIKEAEFLTHDLPVGTHLTIQIEKTYHVGDYAVFQGRVMSSLAVFCRAAIQVMEPGEDALAAMIIRPGSTLHGKRNED